MNRIRYSIIQQAIREGLIRKEPCPVCGGLICQYTGGAEATVDAGDLEADEDLMEWFEHEKTRRCLACDDGCGICGGMTMIPGTDDWGSGEIPAAELERILASLEVIMTASLKAGS